MKWLIFQPQPLWRHALRSRPHPALAYFTEVRRGTRERSEKQQRENMRQRKQVFFCMCCCWWQETTPKWKLAAPGIPIYNLFFQFQAIEFFQRFNKHLQAFYKHLGLILFSGAPGDNLRRRRKMDHRRGSERSPTERAVLGCSAARPPEASWFVVVEWSVRWSFHFYT